MKKLLLVSFLLLSPSAYSQPVETCARPIDDLERFVTDVANLTGGSSTEGRYGSLGDCLDAKGAATAVNRLGATKRKELAGQMLTVLADPQATKQEKANAVALLTELARKGLASGSARDKEYYFDALVEAAESETDPLLRRQAVLNIDSLSKSLSAAQKAKTQKLVDEFLPPDPPYETIFGKDGEKTDVNVVIHGGDDTFAHGSWESAVRDRDATIKKIEPGRSLEITYTVTPDDPTGRLKPVTYHIKVLDEASSGYSRLRVFEDMNDADVPIEAYSYHSQYGRALRESLDNAPESSGLNKVFLLGSCKAKVFRHRTARLFPNASLISTIDSEYFYDMSRSQLEMLEQFANRASWEQIRRQMNSSGAGLLHTDNYQFPHDRRQLDYLDTDGDGVPDRIDTVLDHPTETTPESARNFAAKEPAARDCKLNGERLSYATTVANGILGYSTTTSHLEDKFVSNGWGEYDADGPMFTFEKSGDRWLVKTNPAYSHLDDTAMSAAMLHEFALKGLSSARAGGRPTRDDQIVALAMGAKVLDAWSGSGYWNEYQKKFSSFDKKLDFWTVTEKIDHDDGVTRTTVDHIRKALDDES